MTMSLEVVSADPLAAELVQGLCRRRGCQRQRRPDRHAGDRRRLGQHSRRLIDLFESAIHPSSVRNVWWRGTATLRLATTAVREAVTPRERDRRVIAYDGDAHVTELDVQIHRTFEVACECLLWAKSS